MAAKKLDLDAVIGSVLDERGVAAITTGAVISANVREGLRQFLKDADPEGYAEYRKIKYPGGDGTATDETRVASVRFIFDRARDLLVPHYVATQAG